MASQAETRPTLLSVKDLSIRLGTVGLVDSVSFDIAAGERVALVGESGSGKTVTAQALMRLNPQMTLTGSIDLEGTQLLSLSERQLTAERGARLGMVFQDPMNSLNPLMTIGDQIAETLRIRGVGRKAARARALEVLDELKVERAAERLDAYPHEFSGGMRQRVVLAMALAGEPRLLIADEPTTALDVRVQERVLDLLDEVARRRGLAVLLITHDMGIVAGFADRVMVMYSGKIVETGASRDIFSAPQHPYTRSLLQAIPRIDRRVDRLPAIPGGPPAPAARPLGCTFNTRCPEAIETCRLLSPPVVSTRTGYVSCHRREPENA